MRPQPLIAVTNVEASSRWYQRLLGCKGDHGGNEYERLKVGDDLVLQLHRFDVEHHHGPIGDQNDKPYGNGVLLWFEVDDFEAAMRRINQLKPLIVLPRHRNPNPNHWEIWVRDPDGYVVVIASGRLSRAMSGLLRAFALSFDGLTVETQSKADGGFVS